MMTCCFIFLRIFFVAILLIIPYTDASRCSKKCAFQKFQLNSSIPSDFCPSTNDSNDDIDQNCRVELSIDFTTGYVNGKFKSENQTFPTLNYLNVETLFVLNDTSIEVNITYVCSMSDYCDLEFVRETLSAVAMVTVQMESLRQTLADRLYNKNNTGPTNCSNDISCPENMSFCGAVYFHQNKKTGRKEDITSECTDLADYKPVFIWIQRYTPYSTYSSDDHGVYFCNVPDCGSNATIIETFQWLALEYSLPLNTSVINMTTTRWRPTTNPSTTESTVTTTTTSNGILHLFGHFHIIISYFLIILFLN